MATDESEYLFLDDSFDQQSNTSQWDLVDSEPSPQMESAVDSIQGVPTLPHSHSILPRFPSPFGKAPLSLSSHAVRLHQTFPAGKPFSGTSISGPSSLQPAWKVGGKPKPKPRSGIPRSLQKYSMESRPTGHGHSQLPPASLEQLREKRRRVLESAPQPKNQNTARVRSASDSLIVQQLWIRVLDIFGKQSFLLRDLANSSHQTEHMNRFLNQFAANTLVKYFGALIHWFTICISSRVDPWLLSEVGLSDLLCIHRLARQSNGQGPKVSLTLKALRWAVNHMKVECLRNIVYGGVVSSFDKQRSLSDRRETLPFSLYTLCMWEKQILRSTCSLVDIVVLGTFLVLAWSSLRFADAQRCNTTSLCYSDQVLRGICWQTKTVSNLAWGLIGHGFLSHGSYDWLYRFLRTLDGIYHQHAGDMTIDFLFPSCTDEEVRLPLQAMEYPECLYFLRKYLQLFWHEGSTADLPLSAKSYTVHGLKSTMLSFASQLQIPEELRRIQGKHRAVQSSTRLYSRDDVSSALLLQRRVRSAALSGWRPLTPLARGGQCPLVEPKYALNKYRKEVVEEPWLFFKFQVPAQLAPTEESLAAPMGDSSSDSSSDETSSSESAAAAETQPSSLQMMERGEPLMAGLHRRMWHVILASRDANDSDLADMKAAADTSNDLLRTACGHQFPAYKMHTASELKLQSGQAFCQHLGCKKGWSSLGLV